VVGTFRYMSPERLIGEDYDYASDIWSVGILLVHLWNKCYPFEDCSSTPIDLLSELEHVDLEILISEKRFYPLMRKTILSMLALSPLDRPTCVELSESEWFLDCGIRNLNAAHEVLICLLHCWLRLIVFTMSTT
jgi:serine/threonine protein kinase